MNIKNHVKLSFKSIPENVAFARSCAGAFAAQLNCTLEELEEVKLAISEAVSNCIIHAYQNEPDHSVEMQLNLLAGRVLEIQIIDWGCGIEDIRQAMEPAFSSAPGRMGLGFSFMQSFMDEIAVESSVRQGTAIKMKRSFPPADQALLS
jgi:stage II sporulation protein AB (anti-sigma F factor)